jgi:hypothetical protein
METAIADKKGRRDVVKDQGSRSTYARDRSQRGTAMVEFALVAGIFFLVVFGIIDFARLFQSWVTVQHAAREGARYALTGRVECDIAEDDRSACIQYKAERATTGLTGAPDDVDVSIRSWAWPDYADPPTEDFAGVACDAIEIRVDYDHHLITPLISAIVDHVPLIGSERVLNEPFGRCGGTSY